MTHVIRTPLGLLDLRALAAWNARQRRTREEYEAHPHTGRFDDARKKPCTRCEEPTYSMRGLCAACRKEDQ